MARDKPFLTQYAQYLALRGFSSLVPIFDAEQNLHTAATIGSLFYRMSAVRRRRAEDNIRHSFPDFNDARVAEVAERSMQYMFQLFMVDALVNQRIITRDSLVDHVEIGRLGPVLERMIDGTPMIFITGHCGNWELLGHALGLIGYPAVALARPLDNRFINAYLLRVRESSGMRIITKWGATGVVQETLESNGRIAFIADQNAGTEGMFVPFFGRLASSYKSIGLLAMRYRVPIVVGAATRLQRLGTRHRMYLVDYFEPEDWDAQPDPLFYITARFNHAIESIIRAAPEQYLWLHRRWKSRPRHEIRGQKFPARLVRNLRSLPWMDEDQLARIVEQSEAMAAGNAPAVRHRKR